LLLAVAVICHPLGRSSEEADKKEVAAVAPTQPEKRDVPAPAPDASTATPYTVLRGDSLGKIARLSYRDPTRWVDIYEKNKAAIGRNPNSLQPGQVLEIPR
jgi:nucleoid-associated protein YgaU